MSCKPRPPFCLHYAPRQPVYSHAHTGSVLCQNIESQSPDVTTTVESDPCCLQSLLHRYGATPTQPLQLLPLLLSTSCNATHPACDRHRIAADLRLTAICAHTSTVPSNLCAHFRNTLVLIFSFVCTLQKYPRCKKKMCAHFRNTREFVRTLRLYPGNLYAHFDCTIQSTF